VWVTRGCAGRDNTWEQYKPEATKTPKNAATPTRRVHAVLGSSLGKDDSVHSIAYSLTLVPESENPYRETLLRAQDTHLRKGLFQDLCVAVHQVEAENH